MFDLRGRVAIVTGGAGLLGVEFSRTLAQAGARVIVADLDQEAAQQQADEIRALGWFATGSWLDVTSPDSVGEMVQNTLADLGRIDILVNSAALDPKFDNQSRACHSGAFEDYPLELWRQARARRELGLESPDSPGPVLVQVPSNEGRSHWALPGWLAQLAAGDAAQAGQPVTGWTEGQMVHLKPTASRKAGDR